MAVTAAGKNRIMIYGPKEDGTYVVEFKTAAGEALAISIPQSEAGVIPTSRSGCHMGCSCRRWRRTKGPRARPGYPRVSARFHPPVGGEGTDGGSCGGVGAGGGAGITLICCARPAKFIFIKALPRLFSTIFTHGVAAKVCAAA